MRIEKIEGVKCGMPYLAAGKTAETFRAVRAEVQAAVGYDFFAVCGDMGRAATFQSSKPGVANRSWHKAMRAVDYNQDAYGKDFVLVYEPKGDRVFFRTLLKIRNGKTGVDLQAKGIQVYSNGHRKNVPAPAGQWFDLTACYERHGWERIPAWRSWRYGMGYATTQEWWHYQFDEGMSWDEAMKWLNGAPLPPRNSGPRHLGRNDRGADVKALQERLAALGYLPPSEADGVFGDKTYKALCVFQQQAGLAVDGELDPQSLAALQNPNAPHAPALPEERPAPAPFNLGVLAEVNVPQSAPVFHTEAPPAPMETLPEPPKFKPQEFDAPLPASLGVGDKLDKLEKGVKVLGLAGVLGGGGLVATLQSGLASIPPIVLVIIGIVFLFLLIAGGIVAAIVLVPYVTKKKAHTETFNKWLDIRSDPTRDNPKLIRQ